LPQLDPHLLRPAGVCARGTSLPGAVAQFLRHHPRVMVTLTEPESRAERSALRAGQINRARS
jgi:hypothetical protein